MRRRLPHCAELLVQRVGLLRGVLEAPVDLRVELAEAPVHRGGHRLQPPVHLGVPCGQQPPEDAREPVRESTAPGGEHDHCCEQRHEPTNPRDRVGRHKRGRLAPPSKHGSEGAQGFSRWASCSAARSRSSCAICSALSARSEAMACCSWCIPSLFIELSPFMSPAAFLPRPSNLSSQPIGGLLAVSLSAVSEMATENARSGQPFGPPDLTQRTY